jgi:hypothetical protein
VFAVEAKSQARILADFYKCLGFVARFVKLAVESGVNCAVLIVAFGVHAFAQSSIALGRPVGEARGEVLAGSAAFASSLHIVPRGFPVELMIAEM